jgi:hypothetical protein
MESIVHAHVYVASKAIKQLNTLKYGRCKARDDGPGWSRGDDLG